MLKVRFVPISSNRKTGPIPVSTTEIKSCSPVCPFNLNKDGSVKSENGQIPECYAGFGNSRVHWNKLTTAEPKNNVLTWDDFIAHVKALPRKQLWRHNEAGDLPHSNGVIDSSYTEQLVTANKGKRGFTYTHHTLSSLGLLHENYAVVARMNEGGFTVNHSANNARDAAYAFKTLPGVPVVTLLPMDAPNVQTVDGVKVVACPAEKSDKVTCATCAMCQVADRDYIIGFRAHGTKKKVTDIIARG